MLKKFSPFMKTEVSKVKIYSSYFQTDLFPKERICNSIEAGQRSISQSQMNELNEL